MKNRIASVVLALGVLLSLPAAFAWDAVGHRSVAWLALDGLTADTPDFLHDATIRGAVAWNAAEPDRWRSEKNAFIMNSTYMDHFMDLEDLGDFGMTIDTLPMLRTRYIRDASIYRKEHPGTASKPYNPKLDPEGDGEFSGLLPYAICEYQARLTSQFKTFRMLKQLSDPNRAPQLEMAKANIMSTMGIMAHWVGDAAQPLHTTKHHHGWVGDNPKGYTTDKGIHSFIDGKVIFMHGLNYNTLKPTQKYDITIADNSPATVWNATITYLKRSHAKVEDVYRLYKDKAFEREEGKKFITERLNDGGAMLAALWNNAWANSVPTEKELKDFKTYDGFQMEQVPAQDRPAAALKSEPGAEAPAGK